MTLSSKEAFGTESHTEIGAASTPQQFGEKRLDLKYFFPQLGTLQITLFSESRELFRFLEQAKEIERLKKMPHLGVISKLIESARHTKWEYILLTIYVVHLAKTSKHQIGLSRTVELGERGISISSGEELLKIWTLLINQGHLFGTFVAERSVLLALSQNASLKASFLSAFEDGNIKQYVQRIIDKEDIYHFHHALSFFFLLHGSVKMEETLREKWIEALKAYCLEPKSQQLTYLKQTYRALRRVAYLTLDMNYAPVPLSLNTNVLFSNFDEYAQHIVMMTDHPIVKALAQLDAFIQDEVYLSRDSMKFARAVTALWATNFLQDVRPHPDEDSIQAFRRVFVDQRHHMYGSQGIEKKLTHFTRIRLPHAYLREADGVRVLTEEEKWSSKLSATGASISVWDVLGQREKVIDVFLPPSGKSERAFLMEFFELLLKLMNGDRSRSSNFTCVYNGILCKNLILDVLNHFGPKNITFAYKRRDAFELQMGTILAESRQRAIKVIGEISQMKDFLALPDHRKDQVVKLMTSMQKQSESRRPTGTILASLSEIIFKNETTNQEGEIDGVQLTSSKNGVFLTLVEAKDMQARGNAKAYIDPCDKIKKMGKDKSDFQMLRFRGGAAATLQF